MPSARKDFMMPQPDGAVCPEGSASEKSSYSTHLIHDTFRRWQIRFVATLHLTSTFVASWILSLCFPVSASKATFASLSWHIHLYFICKIFHGGCPISKLSKTRLLMWHKTSLQSAFKLHHMTLLLHIKYSLTCYGEVTPTKKENIEHCGISDRCHAQSQNLHLH